MFGTVFGVATSLGLGVSQMATGLNFLFGVDPGTTTQVILIVIISVVATFSAVSGVGNGIRIISEWNIWLSVVLLAFFLFGGPFQWLMGFFVTAVGDYLWNVIPMGFQTFNEEGAAACREAGRSSTGAGGSPGRPSSGCSSPGSAAAEPFGSSCWG